MRKSLGLGKKNVPGQNHGNRSRRLTVTVRYRHTDDMPNARAKTETYFHSVDSIGPCYNTNNRVLADSMFSFICLIRLRA